MADLPADSSASSINSTDSFANEGDVVKYDLADQTILAKLPPALHTAINALDRTQFNLLRAAVYRFPAFDFLGLPQELCNEIYRHILHPSESRLCRPIAKARSVLMFPFSVMLHLDFQSARKFTLGFLLRNVATGYNEATYTPNITLRLRFHIQWTVLSSAFASNDILNLPSQDPTIRARLTKTIWLQTQISEVVENMRVLLSSTAPHITLTSKALDTTDYPLKAKHVSPKEVRFFDPGSQRVIRLMLFRIDKNRIEERPCPIEEVL
ncbi:hypothetical protein EJ08DRAFT_657363 [Tothia fuscella]|uniref:Uncharacterized protein n=1 Tax=Tothia fuscella TaxID=1048955 RepID=A0A9P4NZK6_9PEZI|nr:hypothetical protein EJ08DRAFT_657363 [Tothia fuscella]